MEVFFLFMVLALVSGDMTLTKTNLETRDEQLKEDPKPAVWPEQFHSVLVMNNTKKNVLQVVDLWYDWPNKRNLNLIQYQLGKKLYDVEYDNHTSYYFTRDDTRECLTLHFDVGILTPDWLHGATYLGQQTVDGFLCNAWTKADFILYYEDVVTKRPVNWIFYTGRSFHVMSFEVGAVLDDSEWQAPVHCFDKKQNSELSDPYQLLRPPAPLSSLDRSI